MEGSRKAIVNRWVPGPGGTANLLLPGNKEKLCFWSLSQPEEEKDVNLCDTTWRHLLSLCPQTRVGKKTCVLCMNLASHVNEGK